MKTYYPDFLKIFIHSSHISEAQKVLIVLEKTIIFSKISNRLALGWLCVTSEVIQPSCILYFVVRLLPCNIFVVANDHCHFYDLLICLFVVLLLFIIWFEMLSQTQIYIIRPITLLVHKIKVNNHHFMLFKINSSMLKRVQFVGAFFVSGSRVLLL